MKIHLPQLLLTSSDAAPVREEQGSVANMKDVLMWQVSWVVLIAYTLLLFKPAVPVFADVIAHTFWEKQHLMTVHEVNGKFHVHYEVSKSSHQSDKGTQNNNDKVDADCHLCTVAKTLYLQPVYTLSAVSYASFLCFYSYPSLGFDSPPPQVV